MELTKKILRVLCLILMWSIIGLIAVLVFLVLSALTYGLLLTIALLVCWLGLVHVQVSSDLSTEHTAQLCADAGIEYPANHWKTMGRVIWVCLALIGIAIVGIFHTTNDLTWQQSALNTIAMLALALLWIWLITPRLRVLVQESTMRRDDEVAQPEHPE